MRRESLGRALHPVALVLGTALFAGLAAAACLLLRKPAAAPPLQIKVAMTPDRIARGRRLFALSNCDGCHSHRDWGRFNGPVIESERGGGVEFPGELGLPGRIASANITSHKKTGIGSWTDGEKIRAIREGIGRDGRPLFPMMPYQRFRNMSDWDVGSLVAYLNTLAPVEHRVSPSQVNFPASVWMKSAPRPAGHVPPGDRAGRLQYGKYLVTLAGCGGCHTECDQGRSTAGMRFAGGRRFRFPGAVVASTNITPEAHTGIGRWSEQEFLDYFYRYRDYAEHASPKVGPESFTLMPWLAFSQLPEGDLRAIYAFLRTRKPVYHVVDSHPLGLILRRP